MSTETTLIPQEACVVPGVYHPHNYSLADAENGSSSCTCKKEVVVTCPFASQDSVTALKEAAQYFQSYAAAIDGATLYPAALLNGVNDLHTINGTLRETSEQASPYSYFSLTEKYGLREMWDEEHAAFYGKNLKHVVSDYVKPVAVYKDNNGVRFLRVVIKDAAGNDHGVDIEASLAKEDPKHVATVLNSVFGFHVYNDLYAVFGKALTVLRLEAESTEEEAEVDQAVIDAFTGVVIRQSVSEEEGETNDDTAADAGASGDESEGTATGSEGSESTDDTDVPDETIQPDESGTQSLPKPEIVIRKVVKAEPMPCPTKADSTAVEV